MTDSIAIRWILFGVCSLGVMLALSHPVEMRPKRWTRILLSAPLLVYLAQMLLADPQDALAGFTVAGSYGVGLFLLGCVWAANLGWLGARVLETVLHGAGAGGGGFRPDFRLARTLVDSEQFEQARAELEAQLQKDRLNYEGSLLLAALHAKLNHPRRGLDIIDRFLGSPDATVEQAQIARELRRDLLEVLSRPASSPPNG